MIAVAKSSSPKPRMPTDEWVRTFGIPPQAPRHVFIWFLIAVALCFAGAFIAPHPLWEGAAGTRAIRWAIYKLAAKAVWLGKVEASD